MNQGGEHGTETTETGALPVAVAGALRFRRLKLVGFKSFVEPTELRIEPGLTGIVGPNGCGKSNLLEAIRWVMGENSPKSMRGGGMEDVIFAGTANRAPRNFAEVSLLTEVSEQALTIAGDTDGELEIVRRIERGAGSAYRANGKDVRAKDVALIFADAATGAHSPALVSQGKIAGVIAAKPTERRMMLEEAAGIAGLHVRRKDAEQKLRAAEANLLRLEQILGDMDARAQQLRRQAKVAERYRTLSRAITLAEARTLFARWREAAAAAEAAIAEARAAEDRVKTTQAQVAERQEAQQAATRALADTQAAAQNARDTLGDLDHRLSTLRADRDATTQRLADLDRQAARIAEDAAREDKLTHDATAALARLEADASAIEQAIASDEARRPELARTLDRAEAMLRDSELALARANAEQARAEADIRVADNALAAARSRLNRCAQEQERARARLAELGEASALEGQRKAALAGSQRLAEAVETASRELAAAEERRGLLSTQRDEAQAALAAARAELHAADREREALERALSARASDGNRALDALRAAPGHEAALAAALGDELGAAIAPASGEGRFWTGAPAPKRRAALPQGWEPLADHVRAPEALAATLALVFVADDDTGEPLMPGERLVTRDGRLRRWDGFVASGEGAAAAEQLARRNRLDALTAARPALEQQVEALAETVANQAKALEEAQRAIAERRSAIARLDADAREALRKVDQAEAALARDQERRTEIDQRLAGLTSEQQEAEREVAEAETARAALPDGATQREAAARLAEECEAARLALAQSQAALSTLDQGLAASRERRAGVRADIRGWQARSGEAAQRLRANQSRAEELAQERTAIAAKPDQLSAAIVRVEGESRAARDSWQALDAAARAAEQALREAERHTADAAEAQAQAREARAGAEARAEHQDQRRAELARQCGERFACPPPLLPERHDFESAGVASAEQEAAEHDRLHESRERLGPVNLVAADELEALEGEIATSRAEQEELTEAIRRLRGSIGSLNREGRQRLLAAFEAVDGHFQRLFGQLFGGGKAHLALIDSDDPLEAGLEIMAQPPGKKLATLTLLSGGEQALTAVALIFALFLTNPAPICVLDEVDAPLDDANIERFCDLLDAMVRETDTRYLIVTHNAVTMSRMHRLFGVTMIEKGVSRLVSVDLGGAEELLAAE